MGFAIDSPGLDDEDEDDDELALAALDSLDAIEVYKAEPQVDVKTHWAQIPVDNWRRLIMLLLIIAPLDSQESLSTLAARVSDEKLPGLKRVTDSILWAFSPEETPGISYTAFTTIINNSLPYLFDGLNPLFEHFLFSKNLDLSRYRSPSGSLRPLPQAAAPPLEPPPSPLLPSEGEILDVNTLCQLSFFLKGTTLFRRLRPLYLGSSAGFSINSLTQKILNWRAPTILLVAGTRLPEHPTSTRARAFLESLPYRRLPPGASGNSTSSNATAQRLVFGAHLTVPWKHTSKTPLADPTALLFQLEPQHDVFHASSVNTAQASLSSLGLGFGVATPPSSLITSNPLSSSSSSTTTTLAPGPISLVLDASLEFGAFTHSSSGGGAYAPSLSRPGRDWQDRFEVESLEVWGCGGEAEERAQREAWRFEEREALARKGIALGRDREADYALLEMAGLVGGGARGADSGGSMG